VSEELAEQLELFPHRKPALRPASRPDDAPRRVDRLRLGVLVSGRGSNLEAILRRCEEGLLPAEVAVVISNHSGVRALEVAHGYGVPFFAVPRAGHASRLEQQQAIAGHLEAARVDLVVLAGFDRVLEPEMCEQFAGQIINVHPSLLPAFAGGLHAIADALAYGVRYTGVTVHFVDEQVDGGPVILQEPVAVEPDDTLQSLTIRVQEVEHRLLPEAIRLYAEGRLRVEGRKVIVET
jgi:phosphoribosylglycinamide formyltransferase-1